MTKDRLGELLNAQRTSSRNNEVKVDIITNGDVDSANENVNLRKVFERAEVLGQWIESIEQNVVAIKQYIGRLDTLSVNHRDLTDKIEALFQNNTSICHKINGKLKEIEAEIKSANTDSAEGRIKLIQLNTLKTRYTKIFKINNTELENFRNIQKENLEAQLRAKGVRVTDEELESLLDNKSDIQIFTENIIAETQEAKRILADIEERHQQLLKIESMLLEVRDLFLQMAILVEAQQDLVDRVEYQAHLAKEYVGKTPKILQNAAQHKIRYLKCKIIFGIVIVVLLAIIIIMLFK
ncbi:syntaxin-1A-like [Diabrotica virgifera virgifera]|uniref:Syntaxin-1A-like n=1 Tax=Diabrotica virgifera virgifera TaxID=50390 RepID=A0A6P7GW29_DIAVI|nr:syntaxin-1A-like [Diabrotica virgifera virgifera]